MTKVLVLHYSIDSFIIHLLLLLGSRIRGEAWAVAFWTVSSHGRRVGGGGERFVLRLNIKKKYSVPVFSIAPVAVLHLLLQCWSCSCCLKSVQYARMHSAAALEVNIRIAAQSRLERRVQIRFVGSYKHACRMEQKQQQSWVKRCKACKGNVTVK